MVDDANANGAGFVPVAGQYAAVIIYAGENIQMLFTLLPVPEDPVPVPEFPSVAVPALMVGAVWLLAIAVKKD